MPNVSLQRGAEAVGDGDFFLADLAVCWGDVIERPPATKKDVLAQLHLHAIAHLGWRCDGHGNTEERIHGLLRSPLESTQQIAAMGNRLDRILFVRPPIGSIDCGKCSWTGRKTLWRPSKKMCRFLFALLFAGVSSPWRLRAIACPLT